MSEAPIPAHLIFEESISTTIDGYDFDIMLKMTAYGEVLETKCLTLELPEDARRLMYGKDHDALLSKVLDWIELYKYKVPIFYAGGIMDYKSLEFLLEKVYDIGKKNNIVKYSADLKYVKSSWVKSLYSTAATALQNDDRRINTFLHQLGYILQEEEQQDGWKAVGNLGYVNFELAGPVIRHLIPFLKQKHNITYAYDALAAFPSDENKAFLFAAYSLEENKSIRKNILKGLSGYHDQDVFSFVVDIYNNDPELHDDGRRHILTCLSHSRNETSEDIMIKELLGTKMNTALDAFKYLKSWGYSEKSIVKKMNTVFYDDTKVKHFESLMMIFGKVKNPYLLPSVDAVFHAIELIGKAKTRALVSYSSSDILGKIYNISVPERIYNLLGNDNSGIRKIGLIQIHELYDKKDHLLKFIITDLLFNKVWELYEGEDNSINGWAFNVISAIYIRTKNKDILEKLVVILKSEDVRKVRNTLSNLNQLFYQIGFQDSLLSYYLVHIDSEDKEIRKAAIEGLKYLDLKEVKDKFQLLGNDPDPEIRDVIKSIGPLPSELNQEPKYSQSILEKRKKEQIENSKLNRLKYYLESKM